MQRRDFLRSSGWFVVGAALVGIPGCGDNNTPADVVQPEPKGTYTFPQGVASGDPRAASVVLWTRVVIGKDTGVAYGAVPVRVQVSADPTFGILVVDQPLTATEGSDHTVRVLVTGLASATTYYYRFVAGQDAISGQTRTAPAADADVQVNLAWVSCQDYSAGHYGAYRQMLVDDDLRAPGDKIHAVVHLGDMIYETRADGFQTAIDDSYDPIMLVNRDGQPRAVSAFPSGGGTRAGVTFAATVDDYRSLYKTFLADPDIQAARARWPFVSIWDDHEFSDDCWQSQANYTSAATLDEADQARKIAASQAWFEYVPVQLTGAGGVKDVPSEAKDFASAKVVNAAFTAPNADNFIDEPNNVAAVGAITIYRSLRFGQHVELVMTDLRSYRSDHAIPEDLTVGPLAAVFPAPRNALPLPVVNAFDQGKTGNNGNPLDAVALLGGAVMVPNLRKASPVGTMLGKKQKAWWKATMKGSDATWKLWGNEVTMMRLKIQNPPGNVDVSDRVVSGDSWDGYPTERNELMSYLKSEGIQNVVVLSGDIHASFAGTVMDDFDGAAPVPVACELVGPGISSNSLFSFFEAATRVADPTDARAEAQRGLITVDAGPTARFIENFNMLLLNGVIAAGTFAGAIAQGAPQAAALGAALAKADPNTNPHLKYADTNSQGYGYVKVTADQVAAMIVTINRPIATPTDAGPGVKRTASFTIPKDNPAGMSNPAFGLMDTKPFPLT
jgi:alkaline phosphatase D